MIRKRKVALAIYSILINWYGQVLVIPEQFFNFGLK